MEREKEKYLSISGAASTRIPFFEIPLSTISTLFASYSSSTKLIDSTVMDSSSPKDMHIHSSSHEYIDSKSPNLTDSTVIDSSSHESTHSTFPLDRHTPSSSHESIDSPSPKLPDSTVIESSSHMDRPSALVLRSSFSAELPQLHSKY